MANLLTNAEIRQHVETDLGDPALDRLIDDADSEIISRLGPLSAATEVLHGGKGILHLARKATSITSVVERVNAGVSAEDYEDEGGWPNPQDYTLDSTDYGLLGDGFRVERRMGSGYPELTWRGRVTIVYVPADETASRKRLLADLVKLAAVYTATGQLGIADARVTPLDYQKEREALFAPFLNRGRRLPLA